MDNKKNDKNGQ